MTYIQTQAAFFAKATGLPKQALADDLTAHVLQLKGQLDAYAKGNYAQAYTLTDAAYKHMFMTGDMLAAGIAKQKGLGSTTSKAAEPAGRARPLLGEHALLATWATQAGLSGGKNFPALAKQLDRNCVEISKAIGSLYGAAAAKQFLNGKNLWRAHINDFVAYTVATAKGDKAGQKKAVTMLMRTSRCRPGSSRRRRVCRSRRGQRPDGARPAAEGRARQLRREAVRQDVPARARRVQAHVHDRRGSPAASRSRRTCARADVALTQRFEEQYGGGGTRVQRVRRRSVHRDLDLSVGDRTPGVVETGVLGADQERGRSRVRSASSGA